MIYDLISNLQTYTPLVNELPAALKILASRNWEEEEVGEYECSHPLIGCTLVEYESSSDPRPYEVYKDKTRLHLVLAGEELMALSWREHARSIGFDQRGKAKLEADPIGVIHAKSEHFALFMPGEPHTVGMETPGSSSLVRKLILTITD